MAKSVYVDQNECTGCSLCESNLPDVFKLNDDNLSEVINSQGASEQEIQDTIDQCPVTAIHWQD